MVVRLKGGEGAIRGGRQKFELAEAQGGTALRDWEISLTGGTTPVVIALLSVKDKQLSFQWTPDAAKQQSSPLLCNCGLSLAAGPAKHEVAFRIPVRGEPLVVELAKPTSLKWQLELMPDPKHLFVSVSRLDGDFVSHKFDKSEKIEASDDSTIIWTGSADDATPLGIRLSTTATARGIELRCAPLLKMPNMPKPKPFQKQDLKTFEVGLGRQLNSLNQQMSLLPKDDKIPAVKQQKGLLTTRIEEVDAMVEQLGGLKSMIENLDGKAKIHFRVFYETSDGPIDLLATEEAPPAEESDKPAEEAPATEKPADDAKEAGQDAS
jgi:hypothetical protein